MYTSSETSVTTSSIITVSPSTYVPTPNSTPPLVHHVTDSTTGVTTACPPSAAPMTPLPKYAPSPCSLPPAALTRSIQSIAATIDRTNEVAIARMPTSAPFFGRRLPKKRMTKNETAGSAGMIQAYSSIGSDQPFSWSTSSRSGVRRLR